VHCIARAAGRPGWNQGTDGTRLPQARRRRKPAWVLSESNPSLARALASNSVCGHRHPGQPAEIDRVGPELRWNQGVTCVAACQYKSCGACNIQAPQFFWPFSDFGLHSLPPPAMVPVRSSRAESKVSPRQRPLSSSLEALDEPEDTTSPLALTPASMTSDHSVSLDPILHRVILLYIFDAAPPTEESHFAFARSLTAESTELFWNPQALSLRAGNAPPIPLLIHPAVIGRVMYLAPIPRRRAACGRPPRRV
jgi:hypothetical protein